MSILTISEQDMPSPSSCVLSVSDVKNGGMRTADGTLVAHSVALKRSLTLGWNHLTAAEYALIRDAARDGDVVEVALDGLGSIDCMLTGESAGVLSAQNGALVWTDVELRFEEA